MPLVYRFPPGQGMVSRLLSVLLLLAVFTVAFFLGAVLFLVILGVITIFAISLYLRAWWLRHRRAEQAPGMHRDGVTLEGEYTVEKRGGKDLPDDRA